MAGCELTESAHIFDNFRGFDSKSTVQLEMLARFQSCPFLSVASHTGGASTPTIERSGEYRVTLPNSNPFCLPLTDPTHSTACTADLVSRIPAKRSYLPDPGLGP